MDWFERLTGFKEATYKETQDKLSVVDGRLRCLGSDGSYATGTFTLPSVSDLRASVGVGVPGVLRLSIVEGDVRAMHQQPKNSGALFQVASQFNMLEMVGPRVTPEQGVTRYEHDRTQGPACAIAAGAATIYRNYLVPVGGGIGQTANRQLDGLTDIGVALAQRLGPAAGSLWTMSNGYALPTQDSLASISGILREADPESLDDLRGLLRVGLHENVEVTDGLAPGQLVSQIFCSALPVAYSGIPSSAWAPFARLILEAAYEATMLAALLNATRGGSNRVLLTQLGGGAFGNDESWIDAALSRALQIVGHHSLDVVIVSYGPASQSLRNFVRRSGF